MVNIENTMPLPNMTKEAALARYQIEENRIESFQRNIEAMLKQIDRARDIQEKCLAVINAQQEAGV